MNICKTYIDMREWYLEFNMKSLELDNTVLNVNGYKVLVKVMPILDTCKVYYIYDTKIDSDKTINGGYYTNEAYETISKCRGDIEDVLFDVFYEYKL